MQIDDSKTMRCLFYFAWFYAKLERIFVTLLLSTFGLSSFDLSKRLVFSEGCVDALSGVFYYTLFLNYFKFRGGFLLSACIREGPLILINSLGFFIIITSGW